MSRASRRVRGRKPGTASADIDAIQAVAGGTRQIGPLSVGVRETSIGVDASKLEAPSQVYDADFGWLEYKAGRLSLWFAKRSRNNTDLLESRLEVRYPPEDFLNTFWKNSSPDFLPKLTKYVALWPKEALETEEPPASLGAVRSHSVWASFTYAAHSGTEASIDFYHMSTAAIARYVQMRSTEGIRLNPVTRVQMTTFELFHLFTRADLLIQQIEKDVPSVHRPPAPTEVE